MIVTEDNKKKLSLDIAVSEEALIEFRRLLFLNGLSVQEFLAFIFIASQAKDSNVISLIDLAKQEKIKNNIDKPTAKPTSPNALYNFLEQQSPIRNQK